MSDMSRLQINELHQRPDKGVFVAMGGGAEFLASLLTIPGASQTVLEAAIPYSFVALTEWLGREPLQACAADTAIAAAYKAWEKAIHFAHLQKSDNPLKESLFGLSITASLSTNRPKRGQQRAFITYYSPLRMLTLSIYFKHNALTRVLEEAMISTLATALLSKATSADTLWQEIAADPGLLLRATDHQTWLTEHKITSLELSLVENPLQIQNLANQQKSILCYHSKQGRFEHDTSVPVGLLSGSFNPLHEAHTHLRKHAENVLGGDVWYEMPILNAEKGIMHIPEVLARLNQFDEIPVVLSNLPRFVDKAIHFPGMTFIIGMDTALRLFDPKFYTDSEELMWNALETIIEHNCRFLVACRKTVGGLYEPEQLDIPSRYRELIIGISCEEFFMPISSTEIRERMHNNQE